MLIAKADRAAGRTFKFHNSVTEMTVIAMTRAVGSLGSDIAAGIAIHGSMPARICASFWGRRMEWALSQARASYCARPWLQS
jgi:hypothetical protein